MVLPQLPLAQGPAHMDGGRLQSCVSLSLYSDGKEGKECLCCLALSDLLSVSSSKASTG